MKVLQSSFLRAICAIIVGALIVQYREETVTWITIAIGVLFFLSGVISIAAYFSARKQADKVEVYDANGKLISGRPSVFPPIVGLGSAILGAILAFLPTTFVSGLMYILAAILILGAVNQYFNLAGIMKHVRVGFFYWLIPSLLLLAGIAVMVKPMETAATPLFIIGWCMMVYGVMEAIDAIKIHRCQKMLDKQAEAIEQTAQTEEPGHTN